MSGLETAAIALGTAVAKAACGVWLGDHKIAAEVGANTIDLISGRPTSERDARRFQRMWQETADLIAERIEPLVEREFTAVPDNERLAALDAVRDTFDAAALTEADLFASDLDAGYLDRYLRSQDPHRARRAGLSVGATSLYDLLLRESCAYAVEVANALPRAGVAAVRELLRRDRQILDDLRVVLERLPARRGVQDFARDYQQSVANRLDHLELFGVTWAESNRPYPLSVAYLSLTVSGDFTRYHRDRAIPGFEDPAIYASTARVEDVLASSRRLFVRGQAGLGKTTLLQWIAVHCARGGFTAALEDWNDLVPFFLPLRRCRSR